MNIENKPNFKVNEKMLIVLIKKKSLCNTNQWSQLTLITFFYYMETGTTDHEELYQKNT